MAPAQPTAETADELLALLDHLRIQRATLVGFSKGAGTATAFTICNPRRVKRLVLISTSGGPAPGMPPSATASPPLIEPDGRAVICRDRRAGADDRGQSDGQRILWSAEAVANELPSARLISLEGGSLYVTSDRPQEVAAAVLAFVASKSP